MKNGVKNIKLKVGLKLGDLFHDNRGVDVLKNLRAEADYFEYQAPTVDLADIRRMHHLPFNKLRPHSVNNSLASPNSLNLAVLSLLKKQCRVTNSPYLADHIGLLNPTGLGPSFGYLIAPALNERTAKVVAQNVRLMQDFCEVPIALENPIIYVRHPESTMTWDLFIHVLSSELPKESGWLIDYAHLKASAGNLGEDLDKAVASYAATRRKVYEVHLAKVRVDNDKVFHDDHKFPLTDYEIRETFGMLNKVGIFPANATIERNFHNDEEAAQLIEEIHLVRQSGSAPLIAQPPLSLPAAASEKIRKEKEAHGRLNILIDRIKGQLDQITEGEWSGLAMDYGFNSFRELVDRFASDPPEPHFFVSLPYYSFDLADGVDITASFYEFLKQNSPRSIFSIGFLRKILVHIAINKTAVAYQIKSKRKIYTSLTINGQCGDLAAGTYFLTVNNDDVVAEQKLQPRSRKDVIFKFDENGGNSWENVNLSCSSYARALKRLPKKYVAKTRTKRACPCHKVGRRAG